MSREHYHAHLPPLTAARFLPSSIDSTVNTAGPVQPVEVAGLVPMVVLGGMVKVNHTIIAGRPLESQSAPEMPSRRCTVGRPALALHRHFQQNEIYGEPTYH